MSTLEDLLSDKSKQSLLSVVEKGDIIRMELTLEEGVVPKNEGDESRNKYFVVLAKTDDGKLIGFVLINSKINSNLSLPLQELHYPLSVSKYPFLQKNRFVDCAELKEISIDAFTQRYKCTSFGKIEEEDLNLIIDAVISSPRETTKHLKKFGLK